MQFFENVWTASYARDHFSFGDLQKLGHLTKRYVTVCHSDPDVFDIEWTVVGDIEFTDQRGNRYKQGDVIVWEG
jgi:hypothetical protein